MSIINNIRNKLPTLRNVTTHYGDILHRKRGTTQKTVTQLYDDALDNIFVRNCVDAYIETTLATGYTIANPNETQTNTETSKYLQAILENPEGINSDITWSGTVKLIWESMLITGDAFFEKSYDTTFGVWNGYKHIPTSAIGWNDENDCYYLKENPSVLYEKRDLIHMYLPDSRENHAHFGTSVIDSAAGNIALILNAMKYNNDLLSNGGVNPKTIIKFGSNVSVKNMMSELKRLVVQQEQEDLGFIALKDVDVLNPAENSRDMSYLELMVFARDNIARAFRVPPSKAGTIETANLGSGSGDSQDKTWKDTFEGRSKFISEPYNSTFRQEGFHEKMFFNHLDIKDDMVQAQTDEILIRCGVKTRNEVRTERGLDPISESWSGYYL